MEEPKSAEVLTGTVAAVIYQNPENGYTVLRLDADGGVVTAVGCMPGVTPGEELELTGAWVSHQSYGQQFKAEFAQRRIPSGVEAIFRYLASGAVKHIGPGKASEIVRRFGEQSLEVLENDPERLAQVPGISRKRALEICANYRRQTGLRRLMEFLSQFAVGPHTAVALYRVFGDDAQNAVADDPYILTEPDFGVEFFKADAMAMELGFGADSPRRIEAAVLFELEHNLNNGHVFLPYDKLADATDRLIGVGVAPCEGAIDVLVETGTVTRETVAGTDACYLYAFREAERYVASRISRMASSPLPAVSGISDLIEDVQRAQGIAYSAGQRTAVLLAASSRVMVLTGGPGTGKTTSIRAIAALFEKLRLKTVFCAPTGRAAKRMSEVCSREAFTIHRLLGASAAEGDEPVFEHNESDPLDADAVIMDETSMVDIMLMSALLRALPEHCRLVMVGDADQLPSVGPGNVFADIIRSGAVSTVKLNEIFRQAEQSRIVKNAHLINQGVTPDLKDNGGDFFFLRRMTPERTAETIVDMCARRLPENMGIPPSQIQVLSPTRKNVAGTANLNACIQAAVNPPAEGKKEKKYGDFVWREGDRVMQIRNNYDIIWKNEAENLSGSGVFNGDIGVISAVDYARETVTVDFDGRSVTYQYDQLAELEPAYAITVHKSQGSEYRAVILAASRAAPSLMVRGVLYSAVTRAKELLVIVGDPDVIEKMTQNDRRARRYSGLRARLAGEV